MSLPSVTQENPNSPCTHEKMFDFIIKGDRKYPHCEYLSRLARPKNPDAALPPCWGSRGERPLSNSLAFGVKWRRHSPCPAVSLVGADRWENSTGNPRGTW